MSADGDRPAVNEAALNNFTRNGCHSIAQPDDDVSPDELADLLHVWNRSGELKESPSMIALRRRALNRRRPLARWARLGRAVDARWAAAAAAAAVALLLLPIPHPLPDSSRDATSAQHFSTGPGEQRIVEMPDGTQIRLDGRTEVSVAYDANRRRVDLKHGRAFFAVHHDSRRPLVVTAADEQTVDLGTRFTVDREEDHVTVALIDGKITIHSVHNGRKQVVPEPGQSVSYRGTGSPARIAAIAGDPLDWTHGTIVLDDVPLAKAVRLLSRYSPSPIQLADDPSLASRSVTGVFHTSNGAEFAGTLASALSMRVYHRADGVDVLSAS